MKSASQPEIYTSVRQTLPAPATVPDADIGGITNAVAAKAILRTAGTRLDASGILAWNLGPVGTSDSTDWPPQPSSPPGEAKPMIAPSAILGSAFTDPSQAPSAPDPAAASPTAVLDREISTLAVTLRRGNAHELSVVVHLDKDRSVLIQARLHDGHVRVQALVPAEQQAAWEAGWPELQGSLERRNITLELLDSRLQDSLSFAGSFNGAAGREARDQAREERIWANEPLAAAGMTTGGQTPASPPLARSPRPGGWEIWA